MLKRDILSYLAETFPEVSKNDLVFILDTFFESISQTLMRGETVEIRGLGRISVKEHAATRARNPRSGDRVDVPKRWTVHFKPSDSLIDRVNES